MKILNYIYQFQCLFPSWCWFLNHAVGKKNAQSKRYHLPQTGSQYRTCLKEIVSNPSNPYQLPLKTITIISRDSPGQKPCRFFSAVFFWEAQNGSLHHLKLSLGHLGGSRVNKMVGLKLEENSLEIMGIHTHTVDGRNPANRWIWSISHYLQGFIHVGWCRIFLPSTVASTGPVYFPTNLPSKNQLNVGKYIIHHGSYRIG